MRCIETIHAQGHVLCRVAAGVEIAREDVVRLGEGGLCLNCEVCTYPNCGFGK